MSPITLKIVLKSLASCGDGRGHNAFKESVIDRALDPEHELSEVIDTFKDILEKNNDHNNKGFIEGITHPSFKNSSRVRTV